MTPRLRAFGPPLLVAILLAGVIPWWIACPAGGLGGPSQDGGGRPCLALALAGGLPALLGAGLCLRAAQLFLRYGETALHPLATPRRLLLQGPYGRARNPYYLGVLLIVLGEAVAWRSGVLLAYALGLALALHAFVVFVEEPRMRRIFGEVYDLYCARVPRWLPAWRVGRAGGSG